MVRMRALGRRALPIVIAAAVTMGAAPSAQAGHINGTKLCKQKYLKGEGSFAALPGHGIFDHGRRVGRVALSYHGYLDRRNRYYLRICAVAIRRFHGEPRFVGVRIKRDAEHRWRRDAGHMRFYAGPVVRRIYQGQSIQGRGTVARSFCTFSLGLLRGDYTPRGVAYGCPGAPFR